MPERFDTAHQVESYFGLVPSERSGGEKQSKGRIAKSRRDDASVNTTRLEGPELVQQAMHERQDLQALLAFALSDELFRLRRRVGAAIV